MTVLWKSLLLMSTTREKRRSWKWLKRVKRAVSSGGASANEHVVFLQHSLGRWWRLGFVSADDEQRKEDGEQATTTTEHRHLHQTTDVWPRSRAPWRRETLPDDVGGRKCGEQSHGQPKAKVIRPVPLDVGQPLVHLHTSSRHKEADVSTLQTKQRLPCV